jgi:1-acyl-sn-glycerol-3-phosphate acyltransferase
MLGFVMNIFLIFKALIGYSIVALAGALCAIPLLINACLPARIRYANPLYYWFLDFFYRASLFASFLTINLKGNNSISATPSIIIANHQSAFDIPLLGSLLNCYRHSWLFLSRYAKIPLFGFILRRMNIIVDRTGLRKLTHSVEHALTITKGKKRHLIIFPEGGRFIDGTIHKFYYGFARIAYQTAMPVVPVFIKGAGKAYPPGSFLMRPYPIDITIGSPFFVEQGESIDSFVARVHEWFVQQTEN